MTSTGMGIEKLPETGSTFSVESTTSIPWLSAWPLNVSLPVEVRMTPGIKDKASVNFWVGKGRLSNCSVLTVVFDKRLVRTEGYLGGPGLKAIGTRFQCVGSGGQSSELVAAVRIANRRSGYRSHRRIRQLHTDSAKIIGSPFPGDYRDPSSKRAPGNA